MNSIIFSSSFLSGGDLVCALIAELTGLTPRTLSSFSSYIDDDRNMNGEFITTELTPEKESFDRLRDKNTRPIFFVRSIFDLVTDQYRYYAGQSPNPQDHHLKDVPLKKGLDIAINGYDSPPYSVPGLPLWARRQQEMIRFAIENPCYILSYEKLLDDPRGQLIALARYLGVNATPEAYKNLMATFARHVKKRPPNQSQPEEIFHYGPPGYSDDILKGAHYRMIDDILKKHAPDLGGLSAQFGLHEVTARPPRISRKKLDRLFVATIFKSGTKLLEHIVERLTGRSPTYLDMGVGSDYEDPAPIRFEEDEFFIWHNVPSPAVKKRLREESAKPVFLIRNIYDLAVAQYFHFAKDVDREIGHSTKTAEYFSAMGRDEAISLVLCGARSEQFTWHGLGYYLHQTQEILKFAKEYPCHVTVFDRLVTSKKAEILELAAFLDVPVEPQVLDELLETSSLDAMREARMKTVGSGNHFRKGRPGSHTDVLKPHHYHMISHLIHEHAPLLRELCDEFGFRELFDPRSSQERYPS